MRKQKRESELDKYFADLKNIRRLTAEEEVALLKSVRLGDEEARKLLVFHNLPLVIHIAAIFQDKGVSLMDLVQEGSLGLLEAIDEYNFGSNARLGTLSTYYIRKNILEALRRKTLIRLPVHLFRKIHQWDKTSEAMRKRLNRVPTFDEVATELNLSCRQREYTQDALIARQQFDDGEEGDRLLALRIKEDKEKEGETLPLLEHLDQLPPKKREVIYLHLGLGGNDPMPLKQIAKLQGVTASATRMRFLSGLESLRASLLSRKDKS
jgi:RNA polymerase sigma factor (sigma-70 family)